MWVQYSSKLQTIFVKVHPFVKARKLAEKKLWTRLFFIKVEYTKDICCGTFKNRPKSSQEKSKHKLYIY